MGWKNRKDLVIYLNRHSQRGARLGIVLELRVEKILSIMETTGQITSFIRHPHNSLPDRNGKDFTVKIDDQEKSFGVTVSKRNLVTHRNRHSTVPQFCFPVETKTETIQQKIIALFTENKEKNQTA